MIYALVLPHVGDLEEVRLLEWHGRPGAVFASGELIAELETHKVIIEVRAGQAGVLRRILTEEGAWQKAGGTMAVLSDTADEALPDADIDASQGAYEAEFTVA